MKNMKSGIIRGVSQGGVRMHKKTMKLNEKKNSDFSPICVVAKKTELSTPTKRRKLN
jgi:hypothetical protein